MRIFLPVVKSVMQTLWLPWVDATFVLEIKRERDFIDMGVVKVR